MAFSDSRIIKFNAPNCAPFTFWRTAVTTSKEAKSLAKVVVPINAKATKQPTKKPLAEKSTAAKALDVTRLPKKNGTKGVSSKAGAVGGQLTRRGRSSCGQLSHWGNPIIAGNSF